MCITPGKLANGVEIACRNCWQCRENRVNDWVGRCLAESKMSGTITHSMTLTYGRDEMGNSDHMRAALLTYSDVQKYFKLLRKDGYRFKYLLAGEYGSEKGRAHWHLIMFWQGAAAQHELTIGRKIAKRFHNKYWPHGHQIAEPVNLKSIRYVCKYINKDVGKQERQAMLRMSKKPPLGQAYFRELAEKYVAQGLAPQDAGYRFSDILGSDGRKKQFWMGGVTLTDFIEWYKATWSAEKGGHHPPSPLIEKHDDAEARRVIDYTKGKWERKVFPPEMGTEPVLATMADGTKALMSECKGYRWYYTKPTDGEYSWRRSERLDASHPYWRARDQRDYQAEQAKRDTYQERQQSSQQTHSPDLGAVIPVSGWMRRLR